MQNISLIFIVFAFSLSFFLYMRKSIDKKFYPIFVIPLIYGGIIYTTNPISKLKERLEVEEKYIELAQIHMYEGDFGKAIDNYMKVLQKDKFNEDAVIGISTILIHTGNIDLAENIMKSFIEVKKSERIQKMLNMITTIKKEKEGEKGEKGEKEEKGEEEKER